MCDDIIIKEAKSSKISDQVITGKVGEEVQVYNLNCDIIKGTEPRLPEYDLVMMYDNKIIPGTELCTSDPQIIELSKEYAKDNGYRLSMIKTKRVN